MEIKSSYSINPDGIYSMLGETKTNALFNLTVHKQTKKKEVFALSYRLKAEMKALCASTHSRPESLSQWWL